MNTPNEGNPVLVRNGSGHLISDRRARPRRGPARGRGPVVMKDIKLALLDADLTRTRGGFDPYDHGQTRKGEDVWGSRRRD